jgi:hypothetical protein
MTNKSWRTIALLRKIDRHTVSVDYLRKVSNVHVRALKGMIRRVGARIETTPYGHDFCLEYSGEDVKMRNKENDLSPSVQSLLHVARLRLLKKVS